MTDKCSNIWMNIQRKLEPITSCIQPFSNVIYTDSSFRKVCLLYRKDASSIRR